MTDRARPCLAVIGAGISGLAAAWLLRERYDVVLFEAEQRLGGHADTQDIVVDGKPLAVDTGFIVLNDRNYPNLTGFFEQLGVPTQLSDMSFGVSIGGGVLEYAGGNIPQLFAQPRNVLRPRFWSMIRDVLRFYREAPALLTATGEESLGDWLARGKYGAPFVEDHLLPMGAAIWSASVEGMRAFPARHFARFFHNHGLLTLSDRPIWRTVTGGSRAYVARVVRDLPNIRRGCPVRDVIRNSDGVTIITADGAAEKKFEAAVLACHADQSLAMLASPTMDERDILGAIRCQDNEAVLHTDAALMPRRRAAWSAWNYLSDGAADHTRRVSITYWMNRLQALDTKTPVLVSLNPIRPPDPARMLRVRQYRHPQFDAAAMRAQAALPRIQGSDRLWFAGAWTGWGFHEDGIASAVKIANALGVVAPWQDASTRLGGATTIDGVRDAA